MFMPAVVTSNEPPVIEVRNVVKEYRLGALEGLRTLGRRMLGQAVPDRKRFRALDDVSFSVKRGEVVGIIGHNGAGKSTLLKMLCNITTPTSGSISVRGRIAPLIEVGAGLVGDMTGRENIYLNASILGMGRQQIEGKVDEIIAFAELEQFIDTPIKRYSSGMQVRLGYAIATAVESDVLIVDEVLAVGDLQFQRKSIERMQKMIQDSKRTVLIVGHNVRQLERICTRILFFDHGKIIADGEPADVTGLYFSRIQSSLKALPGSPANSAKASWIVETSGEVDVVNVRLLNETGDEVEGPRFGGTLVVELVVHSTKLFDRVDIGIAFQTLDHLPVAISPLTSSLKSSLSLVSGATRFKCSFPHVYLLPGVYSLRVGIKDGWGQMLWGANNIRPFSVIPEEGANRARYSDYAFVQFPAAWSQSAPTTLEQGV